MFLWRREKFGFTLIELLVVIAIIGLLSTIAVASLNSSRAKTRDALRISDIKMISDALELYYDSNDAYPIASELSLSAGWKNGTSPLAIALSAFLSTLPVDPNNNDVTCYGFGAHFYSYRSFDGGQGYGIYASLENIPSPIGSDPDSYPCCCTGQPACCMYKASNGGIGIIVRD